MEVVVRGRRVFGGDHDNESDSQYPPPMNLSTIRWTRNTSIGPLEIPSIRPQSQIGCPNGLNVRWGTCLMHPVLGPGDSDIQPNQRRCARGQEASRALSKRFRAQ